MFSLKPKIIIIISLISGFIASYGAYRYLQGQEQEHPAIMEDQIPVVIAMADLPKGSTLYESHLREMKWPKHLVPTGTFSEPRILIGRVLKSDVSKGEAVLQNKLAPEGSRGGMSSLIPPGQRAMTVAVNNISGVGGFILPGAKVDILAVVSAESRNSQTVSRMILQNIAVLAIDQTIKRDSDKPMTVQSVTVLVDPAQAEKLALATTEAVLQMTLRNNTDAELEKTKGVKLSQLTGIKSKKPAKPRVQKRRSKPAPKKKRKRVEIIRSNQRSEVEFSGN